MMDLHQWTFAGRNGVIAACRWRARTAVPRYAAILVHGYGEHIGRYRHVAEALVQHGAVVYGLDHIGHGRSEGERVLIRDFEEVVADVHRLDDVVRDEYPELAVVLIGHSMGGMIAARYAQHHGTTLTALVLSGATIGDFQLVQALLAMDELPDEPLDVDVLSRDPAVGADYASDPYVWHGPFKRTTLEAFAATISAIDGHGSVVDLPMLWVHGADDQLVPIEGTRAGMERLRGTTFHQRGYPGGRHEMFNELNKDDVLRDVTAFIDDILSTDS